MCWILKILRLPHIQNVHKVFEDLLKFSATWDGLFPRDGFLPLL